MADQPAEDNNDNPDQQSVNPSYALKYQATVHSVVSATLLVLSVIALIVFIVSLGKAIKSVDRLIDLKPENRVEQFAKRIVAAQAGAEKQYHEHLVKMEDDSIFAVSDKFKTIYELSYQSEQDHLSMQRDYTQIIYEIASRTKGSGEWHQFYSQKLQDFEKKTQQRVQNVSRYVNREPAG